MTYVPIGIRTEYSFLDGMCRLEALVDRARALRLGALGIADLHSAYALVPFQALGRAAGIRPILGATVRLQADLPSQASWGPEPCIVQLLVRDARGYRNLLALLTRASLENGDGEPCVGLQDLAEFAPGLLALDGGGSGPVARSLVRGERDGAESLARRLRDVFGADGFAMALERPGGPEESLVEPFVVSLARRLNVPLVALSDVRYLEPADLDAHDVLRCIGSNTQLPSAVARQWTGGSLHLRSEPEMRALYRDLPEALVNTCLIAERCAFDLETLADEAVVAPTRSGRAPAAELRSLCERGMRGRYGVATLAELPVAVRDRIAHELAVIEERELASCFLTAEDVVRCAKEEGIPLGPGRGAAAGSIVCYLLGITRIDPLAHGLVFERFLSRSGGRSPEFEFEVEHAGRERLVARLLRDLGPGRAALAPSLTTFSTRSSVREVATVLGFSPDEIDRLAHALHADAAPDLWQTLDRSRELKLAYQEDVRVRRLFDVARRLEGLPRNPTLQAGGLLVAPGKLGARVALQRMRSGDVVAQVTADGAHALGLVRLEIQASRAWSVLSAAGRWIRAAAGVEFVAEKLPLGDEAVYRLFARGDTHGVPQFDGPSMQALLQAIRPRELEDLVATLCLSRPSARSAGLTGRFLATRDTLQPVTDGEEVLSSVVASTHGLVLYQEQLMEIAGRIAGYDADEAESLRGALQRRGVGELARHRARFVRGAVEGGMEIDAAERLFAQLLRFTGFDFDRAHGVSSALLAYACAYVRVHHPVAFAAASLDDSLGQGARLRQAVLDAGAHGIALLRVDVNRSERGFHPEGESVRIGLAAVRRLSEATIERLLEERRARGPFLSVDDFLRRLADLPRGAVESLGRAGALDGFGMHRAAVLAAVESTERGATAERTGLQLEMDFGIAPAVSGLPVAGAVPELGEEALRALEDECLEFAMSDWWEGRRAPVGGDVLPFPSSGVRPSGSTGKPAVPNAEKPAGSRAPWREGRGARRRQGSGRGPLGSAHGGRRGA